MPCVENLLKGWQYILHKYVRKRAHKRVIDDDSPNSRLIENKAIKWKYDALEDGVQWETNSRQSIPYERWSLRKPLPSRRDSNDGGDGNDSGRGEQCQASQSQAVTGSHCKSLSSAIMTINGCLDHHLIATCSLAHHHLTTDHWPHWPHWPGALPH